MRFPVAGDMGPTTYTSSRLTFADDTSGGCGSRDTMAAREESMSVLEQLERPTEYIGPDSTADNTAENSSEAAAKKKSKSLRTPSFFSRSYVAWKKVYDRGVYTPVCSR